MHPTRQSHPLKSPVASLRGRHLRPSQPLAGRNAHSCGIAVPGGLVQHVFSPPRGSKSRVQALCNGPRRRAKNALYYVVHHIRPRSAQPGRSAPRKVATISRSSSTTPPSMRQSTQTCSTGKAAKATRCSGRGRGRTASDAGSAKPRPRKIGRGFFLFHAICSQRLRRLKNKAR